MKTGNSIDVKHIAVVCNYVIFPDRIGGMDEFFWRFQRACEARGWMVDWVFPIQELHGDYERFRLIKVTDSVENTFIRHLQLHNSDYNVVITHFVGISTSFFKRIKSLSGAMVVAVDHNPRPLNGYGLQKRIKKKLQGVLFSRYIDRFIGVSAYTVNELIRDFGERIRDRTSVIYNGINVSEIPVRKDRVTVCPSYVVVSHLRRSKGIQDLIAAVASLDIATRENVRIDVFGEGPLASKLLDKVKEFDLTAQFAFKGSVADIRSRLQCYDYLLQPTHMECFSLSILEGLAANLPVVTTPVGGNLEVVADQVNGYIHQVEDVGALAQILTDLTTGKAGIQARVDTKIRTFFTLDRMVEQYLELVP